MNGVFLDSHALILGAVLLGVWSILALCMGLLLGAAIRQADEHDESTWLDDQPDGRTDTEVITIPREWLA